MGVMEGDSAVAAVYGTEIERAKREKRSLTPDTEAAMDAMREDYDHQLDARHAAARGQVDAIVAPEETRDTLAFLLRVSANFAGPHLGPFVLPPL
jgi:acetyl-CoA carboxylase carboxyltransferase component